MILEIKDFVSSDIDTVWEWKPKRLEDICFVLELEIGYKNQSRSELFQTVIVTPEAIRKREKVLSKIIRVENS